MSALETRRRQATVDRLMDDLRRLVEEERGERYPADGTHEQAERLRWDIANLVRSTANEDAVDSTRTELRGLRPPRGRASPPRRPFPRAPAG